MQYFCKLSPQLFSKFTVLIELLHNPEIDRGVCLRRIFLCNYKYLMLQKLIKMLILLRLLAASIWSTTRCIHTVGILQIITTMISWYCYFFLPLRFVSLQLFTDVFQHWTNWHCCEWKDYAIIYLKLFFTRAVSKTLVRPLMWIIY